MANRDAIQSTQAQAGTGELQREAGRQHKAGFLRDDDGSEYVGQCAEGNEPRDRAGKEQRYEYQANVNPVGVLKDRFIGIVGLSICVYAGTGIRDKTADSTGKAKPESGKKRIHERATFPSQSPIKLLMGEGGEQAFHCLFSLTC
jgi:hypothetical protein